MKKEGFKTAYEKLAYTAFEMTGNPYIADEFLQERQKNKSEERTLNG